MNSLRPHKEPIHIVMLANASTAIKLCLIYWLDFGMVEGTNTEMVTENFI